MRQGLSRINSELTLLEGKARPPARGCAVLQAAYETRQKERNALALDARDVSLLAREAVIPVGTRLFHASTADAIVRLLRDGVAGPGQLETNVNRWGDDGCMGPGLYVSLDEPAYHCDELPLALKLLVVEPLAGASPILHRCSKWVSPNSKSTLFCGN